MNLEDTVIQGLKDAIKKGNDAKAVRNLKQWKETVYPEIQLMKEAALAQVKAQGGFIWSRDQLGQSVPTSYLPVDVNLVQQTMWMIIGIDRVVERIEELIAIGEHSKQQLKSDTANAPEGGNYGG